MSTMNKSMALLAIETFLQKGNLRQHNGVIWADNLFLNLLLWGYLEETSVVGLSLALTTTAWEEMIKLEPNLGVSRLHKYAMVDMVKLRQVPDRDILSSLVNQGGVPIMLWDQHRMLFAVGEMKGYEQVRDHLIRDLASAMQ